MKARAADGQGQAHLVNSDSFSAFPSLVNNNVRFKEERCLGLIHKNATVSAGVTKCSSFLSMFVPCTIFQIIAQL